MNTASPFASTNVLHRGSINVSASGQALLVAAVPGKKIRLVSLLLTVAAAVAVDLQSASTSLTGPMPLQAGFDAERDYGLVETVAGEALNINLGANVQVAGPFVYQLIG